MGGRTGRAPAARRPRALPGPHLDGVAAAGGGGTPHQLAVELGPGPRAAGLALPAGGGGPNARRLGQVEVGRVQAESGRGRAPGGHKRSQQQREEQERPGRPAASPRGRRHPAAHAARARAPAPPALGREPAAGAARTRELTAPSLASGHLVCPRAAASAGREPAGVPPPRHTPQRRDRPTSHRQAEKPALDLGHGGRRPAVNLGETTEETATACRAYSGDTDFPDKSQMSKDKSCQFSNTAHL